MAMRKSNKEKETGRHQMFWTALSEKGKRENEKEDAAMYIGLAEAIWL